MSAPVIKHDEQAYALAVFQQLVNRELTKDELILAQLAFTAGVCDGLQQALADMKGMHKPAMEAGV